MIRLTALVGVLAISFAPIFVRLASVSPTTASVFRGLYALPPLFVLWLAVRRRDRRTRALRWTAIGAGMLLALDLTLWHRSIADIGAGLATVLANTQVVFVGLLAWLVHRERPTRLAFLCVPLVLVGVVLISGLGRADAYGDAPLRGTVVGILSGVAYSGYLLVFRASNRMRGHPAGPDLDASIGLAVGALLLGGLDPGFDLSPHWPAHGWLLALALVAQTFGWLLLAMVLPRLPALETSVMLLLQPIGAMIWGWLLFDERVNVLQGWGALLVLGGIAALQLGASVEPRTPHRTGTPGRTSQRAEGEPEVER
ncbi:MAG: DMT family transporter [Myxococcota bacterium]